MATHDLVHPMTRILVLEDDEDALATLAHLLLKEGYSVERAATGTDALHLLGCSSFELLILDCVVPDMSGLDVCKAYRQRKGEAPVLFLTGKDLIADKERGFMAGADDYLTKPFHITELLLRVRALLRRHKSITEDMLEFGELVLDSKTRQVRRGNDIIHLPPKEFNLLQFLMRHPTEVFSASVLLLHVWPSESAATEQTVRTCVKRLRESIDRANQPSYIQNHRSHGYKLNSELAKLQDSMDLSQQMS